MSVLQVGKMFSVTMIALSLLVAASPFAYAQYGYGGDPVSCTLTATPDLITAGGGTTLNWTVSPNVVSAFLSPKGSGSWTQYVPLDGTWYISGILDTRSYSLTVEDEFGTTFTCDALVTVEDVVSEPPFCDIYADPSTIGAGGATSLFWDSSDNVVSAILHPTGSFSWTQSVPVDGSWYISGIADTRNYTLTVTNAAGDTYDCDTQIVVMTEDEGPGDTNPALSCEVSAVPNTIGAGGATTLVWSSTGAVSAKLSPTGSTSYFADVTSDGSWYISGIGNSRSYTVTVFDGEGNSATCDAPITVL